MAKSAMKFSYHRITHPWQPLTLEVIEAEILDRYHLSNGKTRTMKEIPMPQRPFSLAKTMLCQ
jgi:hypothetical protein